MMLYLNVISSAYASSKHSNLIISYVPFLSFDGIRLYIVYRPTNSIIFHQDYSDLSSKYNFF